jgi:protein-S-isoprenylcysteine O-methyltransferase Ste14
MAEKPKPDGMIAIDWKKVIVRFVLMVTLMALLLFASAGTIHWWEAWLYMAISFVLLVGGRILLFINNPDTAKERINAGGKEDTKSWDKILSPLVALVLPGLAWVTAGLNKRFGLSLQLPLWVQILALALHFLFGVISTWAMLKNRFFSSHVRIQKDRGQTVVADGPYGWVRHPGYAGGILSWLMLPFFFNSWWMAIPIAAIGAVHIVRTALEDRTLQKELPGYAEYAQEVKYRLLPGIW